MTTQAVVIPYDLTRPPVLKPRQEAALQAVAASAAGGLQALTSEYLGSPVSVRLHGVGAGTDVTEAPDTEERSVWVIPHNTDGADCPIWRFDSQAACALIDLMIGVAPDSVGWGSRPLSRLEGRLLSLLCEEMYVAWAAACPVGETDPGPWRCIRATSGVAAPSPAEWVRVAFEITGARITGGYDLYLPAALARLPAAEAGARAASPPQVTNPQVRATAVTATVQLASWHTTLRDLLALQPGQVVPLGVHADSVLSLAIAGTPRLPVQAGTHNGHISVQVVGSASGSPEFAPAR